MAIAEFRLLRLPASSALDFWNGNRFIEETDNSRTDRCPQAAVAGFLFVQIFFSTGTLIYCARQLQLRVERLVQQLRAWIELWRRLPVSPNWGSHQTGGAPPRFRSPAGLSLRGRDCGPP